VPQVKGRKSKIRINQDNWNDKRMKKYHIQLKKKNAPWRVTSGCDNRVRLFTGRHYELPNCSVCVTCPFYQRDDRIPDRGK